MALVETIIEKINQQKKKENENNSAIINDFLTDGVAIMARNDSDNLVCSVNDYQFKFFVYKIVLNLFKIQFI